MKYIIWDRESTIYTLSGAIFTPQEWINEFKWLNIPDIKAVISGDKINGKFIYEFEQFKNDFIGRGCDFSDCTTDEEILARIEQFEIEEVEALANNTEPTVEERTAAALELIAMEGLPDATE